MSIPLRQVVAVGAYILKQHLMGRKRYPLVLMLEPLFRCNLACAGCGKIDYPDEILNQRLSVADALDAVDECGAPVVVDRRRRAAAAQGAAEDRRGRDRAAQVRHRLHQRAAAGEEDRPVQAAARTSPGRSISTATARCTTSRSCQDGRLRPRRRGDEDGQGEGLPGHDQLHLLQRRRSGARRGVLRRREALGVDGVTVSPGYAYERAPDQKHFLNRPTTKQLFRDIFRRGDGGRKWAFNQSSLFLDFLAGNQTYHCTPWGNPTRTVFGWQRPCYLLGEGYAETFKELMEDHRLGRLRHRQLREMRRLHGP